MASALAGGRPPSVTFGYVAESIRIIRIIRLNEQRLSAAQDCLFARNIEWTAQSNSVPVAEAFLAAVSQEGNRDEHDLELLEIFFAAGDAGSRNLCRARGCPGTERVDTVGLLTCKLNPSVGFIIAGHQSMECSYKPSGPYPPQAYLGAINTVGLDIGITGGGVLGWAVFAPTRGIPAGALAGEYVGASGDIGIGVGAGANVLIGGSGRTFALQPVSLEGSIAVNVALGVSMLKLRAV